MHINHLKSQSHNFFGRSNPYQCGFETIAPEDFLFVWQAALLFIVDTNSREITALYFLNIWEVKILPCGFQTKAPSSPVLQASLLYINDAFILAILLAVSIFFR